MAVLLCSADTAAGQASFILKTGPSAYGPTRVVRTGRGPLAAVQCADGLLYLAVSVSDKVLVLGLDGAAVSPVRVGWAPRCLALVPGTPYLLVANAGSDSVSVVDTAEAREVARTAVGREPGAIAVSPDGLWAVVCERGAGSVAVVDLSGLGVGRCPAVVARVEVGAAYAQPRAVAVCDGQAVVACARLDVLPVVDVAGGRVKSWVPIPVRDAAPAGVALTGEGGYALVTLERAGALAVVDLLDETVTRLITLGSRPRGVTVDPVDATVYCALAGQRSLAVVHLDGVDLSNTDGTPQFEEIPVGAGPSSVALAEADAPPFPPLADRSRLRIPAPPGRSDGLHDDSESSTHMPSPRHSLGEGRPKPARGGALAALLGATRARILMRIAAVEAATTNELVRQLSVSAATVSHHTGVLRASALITTERDGVSVHHALTPLGQDLLGAHGVPCGTRPRSGPK
ncbi:MULTISPECIES: hypothetical protein [unclassified Streptomyces]|uniref:hypothetical protein n=1 Tax=unclassified Streptomyces TaxID=2593676 RepID=UPI0037F708D1